MLTRLDLLTKYVRGRTTSEATYGRVWVITSALIFGAMAVVTRSVSSEIGAAQIAVIRFALDLAAVIGLAVWRPGLVRVTKPLGLAARGMFGGAAVLGYFMAIERLSAGLGTMLNYMFPLWAAVAAAIFLGEMITWWTAAGMLTASVGLVAVIGPSEISAAFHGAQTVTRVGVVAGVVSGVLGGAATTTMRWLRRTESALAVFGAFCLGGLVVCLPPAFGNWRPVSTRAAVLLVAVAVLSFAGQMLYTYALKFVTAGSGSLAMQLTVVTSYVLAALMLGESIRVQTGVGGLLVMLGVTLVSRQTGQRVADAAPARLPAGGSL